MLRHNAILEEQITQGGGRILEMRGDGVVAAFENANPLPVVLEIQRQLGRQSWGEIGELRIRIGLHGVPEASEGVEFFRRADQYYGPVLNHTARITAAGWGGQILASEQVQRSLALPDEASWLDFGWHDLKGVDRPEGTSEQLAWFNELQRISAWPQTASRIFESSAQVDVSELAKTIEAPTLVMHARQDALIPQEEGRRLAGSIPGARFVLLEGKNHILLENEPAWGQFKAEVKALLEA